MRISVIVCTRNRARLLERTLVSLCAQSLPATDYEIVVVDNGSSDDTAAVIQRSQSAAVAVTHCHEPEIGLSRARNLGLARARAPLVAFIDDDAEADSRWLESLDAAFRQEARRPIAAGGRVLPIWGGPRPSWLPAAWLSLLSVLDYGPESHECDFPREFLIGCNIAFERSFLLESGGFDPRLGRRGQNLTSNEELRKQQDVHSHAGLLLYRAEALVHHFIPRERLTLSWLLRRIFAQGASDVVLEGIAAEPDLKVGARRRWGDRFRRSRLVEKPPLPQVMLLFLATGAYELGRVSQSLARFVNRPGKRGGS